MEGMEFNDYKEFENNIDMLLKKSKIKVTKGLKKAIRNSLGESDKTSKAIFNNKHEMEADSELKDYEKVPLNENIEEYFEREVKPHYQMHG